MGDTEINSKNSFIKTVATVIIPIVVALLGIFGNNKYMAWRMDNVERKVGSLENKIDDVAKVSDKTNELLIQFLINRGYAASRRAAAAKKAEGDGVYMYFGHQALQLKEEKDKLITEEKLAQKQQSKETK